VDCRCDLDLAGDCVGQAALSEEVLRGAQISILVFVLQDDVVIVCEFVKGLLVDEAVALIDQNVGILGFLAALVHENPLHVGVVSVLLHLGLPVLVFATEALFGDLTRFEVLHMGVIEFVPLVITFF